jgi:hypothetical protein
MGRKEIFVKTPERDYSHRSLYDKLGVKEESRVALLGKHDEAFLQGLAAAAAKSASKHLRGSYDIIFLKVDVPRDLAKIAVAAEHLVPNGRLWIFHPKGKGASPSDGEGALPASALDWWITRSAVTPRRTLRRNT